MKIMDNTTFASCAKKIAMNHKTLYVMGCFGSPMNDQNKDRYTKNYTYNMNPLRKRKIMNASPDTFGFDCVCLIKGILWGWNGDSTKIYGGASYSVNGVVDVNADEMMNYCDFVSSDFSHIEVGEVVHIPGHIGIYVGDDLVVECTPAWLDGVQFTSLSNRKENASYPSRKWKTHGKLQYIHYKKKVSSPVTSSVEELAYEVIRGVWGNGETRKQLLTAYGYDYNKVQSKVNEILGIYYPIPNYNGESIVDALKMIQVDSSFLNRRKIAIKNKITNYIGSPEQNKYLLKLLKDGKLIKK